MRLKRQIQLIMTKNVETTGASLMGLFHAKFMINAMILILRLLTFLTWMGMCQVDHPMVSIYRN